MPDGVRLIRLNCRGGGSSDWTGRETYSVTQQVRDALALLDHLGIDPAVIIGSSRGGLPGLVITAIAPPRPSCQSCRASAPPPPRRAPSQRHRPEPRLSPPPCGP
ncbi:hypothetical protein CCR83_03425 [Rhodobacter veldkampii DSM 11550]|uniref:AB hydrolase-1 domain-containing protein n=1 Tax=Phaeovulum veldkampii DSM 11550 TaxID=1185920 RepID=A0A2T4JMV4_9RHOB|nr:alpha/beta hydrolase [Phaeovulum veldkampii]MBK5945525.1 hypothetical protein [Phaeovulum veldkampii DSM 11550]NCU19804.1 alpha/beta fold hydrolase [Candidatus Falkowbacteria bacterium]PTE19211.1 hypothetical protein C5F46_00175 [Phaeovulum veldkampii DSM 11550]